MHHPIFLRAALCALLVATSFRAPAAPPASTAPVPSSAPARLPPPPMPLQAQAQSTIHTLFAADFAKTPPADRLALARKLLAQAQPLPIEEPARYVALLDAIDLAASAGDAALAMQAIDDLDAHYRINPLELRRTALLRAGTAATTEAQFQSLTQLALETADRAADIDDFATVLPLATLAETAANKSRQLPLIAAIQVHLADLRALAQEYANVKTALARLATTPDDPPAHARVGRYYALDKGQWDRALPHLAAGDDPALADLATRELAKPADGIAQTALADDWWNYAATCTGPAQRHVTAHAIDRYKIALQTLKASTLSRIQARIDQAPPMPTATPPIIGAAPPNLPIANATPAGATVALLPLIDPARDAAQGQWTRGPDGITCAASPYACLQLPYLPPEEYDLTAEFTRTADDGPIALLLAAQKRAFEFVLDIKSQARLERVNGKVAQDNPTVTPVALSNGHRYRLTLEIRADHVRALLDGKELVTYKTDFKDLSRYSNWKLGDNALCGIGANGAQVTFHAVELREVKGQGKPTR